MGSAKKLTNVFHLDLIGLLVVIWARPDLSASDLERARVEDSVGVELAPMALVAMMEKTRVKQQLI